MKVKHKVRCMERDLERRERDVEELRVDVERQCDRYNEL